MLDIYPRQFFSPSLIQIFHLDSDTNVHAANIRKYFIIYFPIKCNIHLPVGSTAQYEAIGAVLTKNHLNATPILLAFVFYCPLAKLPTLFPSALKHYNSYHDLIN